MSIFWERVSKFVRRKVFCLTLNKTIVKLGSFNKRSIYDDRKVVITAKTQITC